jgi:DNA-binding transcriptional MerR regulator
MEKDLGALRTRLEESERLASQRGAEVAEAVARAESAGRTLEELRTELSVTRNESSAVRGEADRRSADLRRRVQDLEAQAARHEERVVKAYQKIKSDEKLKEKTRKALTVALQLLDERLPPEGAADAPPAPAPEQPAS